MAEQQITIGPLQVGVFRYPRRQCEGCGAIFQPTNKQPKRRFCSTRCRSLYALSFVPPDNAARTAEARGATQRGRGQKKGYRKLMGRHEHRVVAEQKLGRPLMPGELVHHDDEDRQNNTPSNLVVTNPSDHARIHFSGRKHSPEHIQKRMASRARTMRARGLWK